MSKMGEIKARESGKRKPSIDEGEKKAKCSHKRSLGAEKGMRGKPRREMERKRTIGRSEKRQYVSFSFFFFCHISVMRSCRV